ncbi:MAG: hypothetical protein ACYC3S_10345 [Chloroflexota bacterium]
MKRWQIPIVLGALLVAVMAGALTVGPAVAWFPGGQTPNGTTGKVPYGMGWGYGPGGMMGGSNGMMGGWGWSGGATANGQTITLDQARTAVSNYIEAGNWQGLTIAEVMEFRNNYYAVVKEQGTGVGAFEVLVDKYSGSVFGEMGPNMMWNTKYGHMRGGMMGGGMMGYGQAGSSGGWWGPGQRNEPSATMPVTPARATSKVQTYLGQYLPGTTTEEPVTFYGYYTLHTLNDGKVTGMLSVNGYTGAVWYHSWHGAFIQESSTD